MIGPKKTPHDFEFGATDSHLVVNDISETVKAFSSNGKLLWEVPCLARGQGPDTSYKGVGQDTPPGLYRIGQIYRDYDINRNPPYGRDVIAYGWYSFDLLDLEQQESKLGRAGIMIHGGGSACGWPGAWAPLQQLFPTLGCVRMHNVHLRDRLFPLAQSGRVYVSVYQEG
jgi:hypothetical protein